MANSNQVKTVKRALELKKELSRYTPDGKEIDGKSGREVFPSSDLTKENLVLTRKKPQSPEREIINRAYPPIVPQIKFNWIFALAPLVAGFILPAIYFENQASMDTGYTALLSLLLIVGGIIWIPVFYFAIHRKRVKAKIEDIRNSAEYKKQCDDADSEYDKIQDTADVKYQAAKKEYDEVILPKYEKRYAEAKTIMDAHYKSVQQHIAKTQAELDTLFSETKIIPVQYQTVEALEGIHAILASSNYDIEKAFEMYDRDKQRQVEETRLLEQQEANRLAEVQLQNQQYANQLAEEQLQMTEEENRHLKSISNWQKYNTISHEYRRHKAKKK